MKITTFVGDTLREFTDDHRESGQIIRYTVVLEALQKCSFASKSVFDHWMMRLKDAGSPSSRLAVCRQMIHECQTVPQPSIVSE